MEDRSKFSNFTLSFKNFLTTQFPHFSIKHFFISEKWKPPAYKRSRYNISYCISTFLQNYILTSDGGSYVKVSSKKKKDYNIKAHARRFAMPYLWLVLLWLFYCDDKILTRMIAPRDLTYRLCVKARYYIDRVRAVSSLT